MLRCRQGAELFKENEDKKSELHAKRGANLVPLAGEGGNFCGIIVFRGQCSWATKFHVKFLDVRVCARMFMGHILP